MKKDMAVKLHHELLKCIETYNENILISNNDIKDLLSIFMPFNIKNCQRNPICFDENCESRCTREYWLDHGRLTQELMESVAIKMGKDKELYGRVGYIHDIDYLMHPHDKEGVEEPHPISLINVLIKKNINPIISMSILEHAAYAGLYINPTSRLSATLSACEDLATLLSIKDNDEYLIQLSQEAKELASISSPKKFIDQNIEKPRVIKDIDKYINKPLKLALDKNYKFKFKL